MKKKEVVYYNENGQRVTEKLMIMTKVNSMVSIEEAGYNTLSANMQEIFHWAVQCKEVYDGWAKVFEMEEAVDDVVSIIRRSTTIKDCIASIVEKYNISDASAEALADLSLPQLTGLDLDISRNVRNFILWQ